VFRTPGGVRVGRTALEPEVLREIEARYPDIAFDWKDVREHQQHIELTAEPRRRRPPTPAEPPAASPEQASAPAPSAAPPVPASTAVPSVIEGATPDDQIAFLARWYPVIRDRVPRRTSDPARQEALLALTERLNPAAWTDADEIAAGLPHAAEALERLARVFARRRRRARRPTPEAPAAPPDAPSSDS
jgi:hypothetical protein